MKLHGGGCRGQASKRPSFPPLPPPNRRPSRLSLGGIGNPLNKRPVVEDEETFSLVPSERKPRGFAVSVKLVPGLVEELKKVEALGGSPPRIKFSSSGTNPFGNVIHVGGKEFKFTWSTEFADLFDIYEEQQSGRDGNHMLVESGSCCRKVNVQRILDKSTTNHVKMLCEEAERKQKSRKAIVLDHGNPSIKSQTKQMAAAEIKPWKSFHQKQGSAGSAFKKQKVEVHQGPPKSFKSGSAPTSVKVRRSSSPLASPVVQSGIPASALGTGSISKSRPSTEGIRLAQMNIKENAANSEKEISTSTSPALRDGPGGHKEKTTGYKGNISIKPLDLESMLITPLKENPKGMSLETLEKAVGGTFPNSTIEIEPVLKKFATFQGGRYFLKPGLDLDSIEKLLSDNQSSLKENQQNAIAPNGRCDCASDIRVEEKNLIVRSADQSHSNSKFVEELNALWKDDIQQKSPNLFGDKKVSDINEGQCSGAGGESDRKSESSESESDTGSRRRRKSRSPVGSGSESSSDSESDTSSNSKDGSDKDVDIMTSDEEKEPQQNLRVSDPGFLGSAGLWTSGLNATDENQVVDAFAAVGIEGQICNAVEIAGHDSDACDSWKNLIDDEKEIDMVQNESLVCGKEGESALKVPDHDIMQDRETFLRNLLRSTENLREESFRHELPQNSQTISKRKSKRGPDLHFDEKLEHAKKAKTESSVTDHGNRYAKSSESPLYRQVQDNYKGPAIQVIRSEREANTEFGFRACNQATTTKPNPESQQSGRRSSGQIKLSEASDTAGEPKYVENSGQVCEYSKQGSHVHQSFPVQKGKGFTDKQHASNVAIVGGRNASPFDSNYTKLGEILGKSNDVQVLNSCTGSSPKDGSTVNLDKIPVASRKTLQRELSGLDQGEYYEPLSEETPVKWHFERKGSFKHSENKANSSENCNLYSTNGKPVGNAAFVLGRPSGPNISTEFENTREKNDKSLPQSNHQAARSLPQHFSGGDTGSEVNKLVETGSRSKHNDARTKLENYMEGQGEGHRKGLVNLQPAGDTKCGLLSCSAKESKTQPSNKIADLIDGQKDVSSEDNHSVQIWREPFAEEDSSYFKYEKGVPDRKGPIKDINQYKTYVQEYREKYDSYCTIDKILKNYRSEFHKLGVDLEYAKSRDMEMYHMILVQLKESYCQCGPKHIRLKKVFVVLHEELKNLKQRIKEFAVQYSKG